MSWLEQSEINQREDERTRYDVPNNYPKGICPCCGGDDGLNEDGIPCGYCKKGIDKEER